MKNIIKFLYISLAIVLIYSCERYTEDLNNDPNAFTQVPSELLIGQVQLAFMQHMESNTARYAGVFSNHFSGCDRQYLTLNTYSPNRGNYNDMWNDSYIAGVAQAKLILDDPASSDLLKGIAQIFQGALFAEMALLYGDVPFTEAADSDQFPNPSYEPQADVIRGGINIIKQGINNVGTVTVEDGFGGNRLQGGNWRETANTLIARYELSLGNYAAAITAANSGITTRANSLVVLHGTSLENRNLYYQFTIDERQDYLCANSSDGAITSYLYKLLNGDAPRTLATPGDTARRDNYFITQGNGQINLNTSDGARFAQTTSFPLVSYYENQLILAESYAKSGNDASALVNLNNVRKELGKEYDMANGFPNSSATGDELLKQILEEKYITLVGEVVTFHDLRRTGNLLAVPLKETAASTTFPQRFLYTQGEVDTNSNIPNPQPGFFDKTSVLGKPY